MFGYSNLGHIHIVSGKRPAENPDNAPRYQSNNYAILGSLFIFVTYPSFNSYWAPDALRVFVATGTFAALMAGGMFSFIFANLLYPEGPSVMHLQVCAVSHTDFESARLMFDPNSAAKSSGWCPGSWRCGIDSRVHVD